MHASVLIKVGEKQKIYIFKLNRVFANISRSTLVDIDIVPFLVGQTLAICGSLYFLHILKEFQIFN